MNYTFLRVLLVCAKVLSVCLVLSQEKRSVVWENDAYTIYNDSVREKNFVARILSSRQIVSDYKNAVNLYKSPAIQFKFSINGKDNEMVSGRDHHFNYSSSFGRNEMPLIRFGEQYRDTSHVADGFFLPANSELYVRLDMRHVLSDFKTKGFFETYTGEKIYRDDFRGVYVAGSSAPLTWDFSDLANRPDLKLEDENGDGIYEGKLVLNAHKSGGTVNANWALSRDISSFPQYKSDYAVSDAIYNLALEEMQNAIEADGTFRTGKEWAGVWTRDISYSIILSMAYLQPEVAMASLMRKVNKKKRIIQDTGTGGAWPVSTDRVIWAVAAWEIYKATQQKHWLTECFEIIKNTIDDDMRVAYDKNTGLMKGESSFLDWREQTYPAWMEPADIYESECLSTNAVFYEANMVLSRMAAILKKNKDASIYRASAEKIKDAINRNFWVKDKGYFGQYLYGRTFKVLSPRSEALGEALCVLFGIADADRQKEIVSNTPVLPYGIPCIYPQIPNLPPYHNNAVWPFVQSYWAMAAAKTGNERSVMESISAVYRPAALFLTNKENFVASTGDWVGTQINSSNMLWSLSGSIALVHKVLFGIHFETDGLRFDPFVPHALRGKRTLSNFKYVDATLDIELSGYGNVVRSFLIDGKPSDRIIPANLKGRHKIVIILEAGKVDNGNTNSVGQHVSLAVPRVTPSNGLLTWQRMDGAKEYRVLRNGRQLVATNDTGVEVSKTAYAQYQVIAIDSSGYESFASEPVVMLDSAFVKIIEIEKFAVTSGKAYKGYSASGFVETSKSIHANVAIPVIVEEDGEYLVDFRYANGNGPVNTDNKCAIRTLREGNRILGAIVMPQRGMDEWSNWGWTNGIRVNLKKGENRFTLTLESYNENMNGEVNQAMLDCMRMIKMVGGRD